MSNRSGDFLDPPSLLPRRITEWNGGRLPTFSFPRAAVQGRAETHPRKTEDGASRRIDLQSDKIERAGRKKKNNTFLASAVKWFNVGLLRHWHRIIIRAGSPEESHQCSLPAPYISNLHPLKHVQSRGSINTMTVFVA